MTKKTRAVVPYLNATSGNAARDEIMKILRGFGCESVGFMDDFENGQLLLAFKHRGRAVQMSASAKGYAQMVLRRRPWSYRSGASSRKAYEERLLAQGMIAVNSILRDWVKGQITGIECGVLSFEAVFMPYMLTRNGTPVLEAINNMELLPPPSSAPGPETL